VPRPRAACPDTVRRLAPEDLGFLDEPGWPQALPRLYARAPRGQRAYATQPVHRGRHRPRLGALSLTGLVAAMTVEGCTAGAVFLALLREGLLPPLRPGPMLLLDHRKAPKVAGVATACAAAGGRRLYRPPYSPEWSPIAAGWSKVKTFLRAPAARTLEALEQAITAALDAVTAADARGWFAHAGYGVASK
jgi:transposase